MPPRIIKIVPQYEHYRFFMLEDGRIVIVDPKRYVITARWRQRGTSADPRVAGAGPGAFPGRKIMDNSIYQARWILAPILALPFCLLVVGAWLG